MVDNIDKYLSSELILVSDVHLRQSGDMRGLLLRQLLKSAARHRPGNFVLLGDVFDFCLGGSRFFKKKFFDFGTALEALAQSGTRVIFFEGNHEFNLAAIGWQGIEFVPEGSMTLLLSGGTRVRLSHGDLIYAPKSYLWFRGLVKSRFARQAARAIPTSWLDAYALGHSKVSRAQDKYRVLAHDDLLQAAEAWIAEDQAQHGIFGHFHTPYGERRQDQNGLIVSVDSWDKPNALIYNHERGFERIFWGPGGLDDFTVQPLTSLRRPI